MPNDNIGSAQSVSIGDFNERMKRLLRDKPEPTKPERAQPRRNFVRSNSPTS